MVRIIPWKLPEVKGGSLGGYTPRTEDADPVEPLVYYDFSGVAMSGTVFLNLGFGYAIEFTANQTKDLTGYVTKLNGSTPLTGIQAVDLLGVSSLAAKVTFTDSTYDVLKSTGSVVISLDPLTYALSYSGTEALEVTNTAAYTKGTYSAYVVPSAVDSITFYVYNGNGEIIQQEEVTFE